MKFIVNDREPVYVQIIRNIKQKVVTGELKMGKDFLPEGKWQ